MRVVGVRPFCLAERQPATRIPAVSVVEESASHEARPGKAGRVHGEFVGAI